MTLFLCIKYMARFLRYGRRHVDHASHSLQQLWLAGMPFGKKVHPIPQALLLAAHLKEVTNDDQVPLVKPSKG